MIHVLLGLGTALVVVLFFTLLKIPLWLSIPLGLVAGVALFIYLGKRVQGELEKIFKRT